MKMLMHRVFAACLCTASVGMAAPQPAIVQAPNQWTVSVRFEPLRQVSLAATQTGQPRRFWYAIVSIENATSRDIDFYPQADLLTDTFQLVGAGNNVPAGVFQIIKAQHAGLYPLLEEFPAAGSAVFQGHDHARDFAVIWPDFDTKARTVSLFIGGLSNEAVVIDHPIARDQAGSPLKVFLKKTLAIDFELRGDSALRSDGDVEFVASRWVMR